MKTYPTNEIKNVVLLGASGAGKTTLAEAMAFDGKVIDRRGSIETDSTLSDFTDIESIRRCYLPNTTDTNSISLTPREQMISVGVFSRPLRLPTSASC